MTLLRIDASIRGEASATGEIADLVEAEWQQGHPGDAVVRRHLGLDPLPSDAWAAAVSAAYVGEDDRTDAQRAALALAATLTDELLAADAVLIAAPLYNYGPSQHVKTWVDLVIADPRGGDMANPLIAGKPVVLVVARGGSYAAGTPREGYDHLTPWLDIILGETFGADVTVVEREWALVGVNPALDAFKEQGAQQHEQARSAAREAGRALGVPATA